MYRLLVTAAVLTRLVIAQGLAGQEVQTTGGPVIGHTSPTYPKISEYLGIRYAETTAGENRFLPPKPFNGTKMIVASQFVRISVPESNSR
jgi:carboxylesterase type B